MALQRECFCDRDECNFDDELQGPPIDEPTWHHGYTAGIVGGSILAVIGVIAIAVFKCKKNNHEAIRMDER